MVMYHRDGKELIEIDPEDQTPQTVAKEFTEEDMARLIKEAEKIRDLPIQVSAHDSLDDRMTNPKFSWDDMQRFAREKLDQIHDNKAACGIQFTVEESVGAHKILRRIFDITSSYDKPLGDCKNCQTDNVELRPFTDAEKKLFPNACGKGDFGLCPKCGYCVEVKK